MNRLPKLSQLEAFQAVINHGSFRAAAEALNQTQPALTRSIRELETTLGVPLLVRGAKGVVLTEMGRVFRPRMQLILNEIQRATDEIEQIHLSSSGTVTLGCSYLLSFSILPDVITKFQNKYPQVNIIMTEGQLSELLPDLRIGQMDFFIGIVNPHISLGSFIEKPLMTSEFCVVAAKDHPLAMCTSLAELKEAKWYLPKASAGYYSDMNKLVFPNGRGQSSSLMIGDSTILGERLILNEGYLTIAPKELLNVPYLKDRLCSIPIKESFPQGHYSFIHNQHVSLTPMAQRLVNEIFLAFGETVNLK
ncbi:LysR-family transcriptional regulatory protein [Yersinia frederiksenii]|uniref:LysR substrate-binding domain-containing protein n=1 Tax=Yersinia frederiksenii TaxID=29484 RepID=UPI0005E6AF77|nr:LysR substrate-binding domain-containing protein [Yersinia frederiksenii]CFR07165.1 LysR-family transcriptional regulatory protein [Yersinia frederiksenii]